MVMVVVEVTIMVVRVLVMKVYMIAHQVCIRNTYTNHQNRQWSGIAGPDVPDTDAGLGDPPNAALNTVEPLRR